MSESITLDSALAPADIDSIETIARAAEQVDGVAPLGAAALTALHGRTDSSTRVLHLVARAVTGGQITGYAVVTAEQPSTTATVELVVDPDARRNGVGTALARAAVGAASTSQLGAVGAWAHGNLAGAQQIAARLGFRSARELWMMRRPLGDGHDLPDLEQAPGMSIRTVSDADDAEILRVNNAAFDWHPEQGGWTERDIAAIRGSEWFDPAGVFVAIDDADGRLLGFHWTKIPLDDRAAAAAAAGADERGGEGEVYIVGVDPAAQGRGIGRAVTLRGVHYLSHQNLASVNLYVEGDNAPAIATYRRLGFERATIDVQYAPAPHR